MITNGSLVFILHRNTASFPSLGRSLTETGSSKISVPIGGGGGGGGWEMEVEYARLKCIWIAS